MPYKDTEKEKAHKKERAAYYQQHKEERKAYQRKWKEENPEKVREQRRRYNQRLKQRAYAAYYSVYVSDCCFVCGSRKNLHFHKADGKPHPDRGSAWVHRQVIKNPEDWWLLCRKCHKGKKGVHTAWKRQKKKE